MTEPTNHNNTKQQQQHRSIDVDNNDNGCCDNATTATVSSYECDQYYNIDIPAASTTTTKTTHSSKIASNNGWNPTATNSTKNSNTDMEDDFDITDGIDVLGVDLIERPSNVYSLEYIQWQSCKLITAHWYRRTRLVLIFCCCIILALRTFYHTENDNFYRNCMDDVIFVIQCIFCLEICIDVSYYQYYTLYNGWLLFDIVLLCIVWFNTIVNDNLQASSLLIMRGFRLIRALRKSPFLYTPVRSLLRVLSSLVSVGILFLIQFFMFSVLCTDLFQDLYNNANNSEQQQQDYDDDYLITTANSTTSVGLSEDYFGRLDQSMLTLFQIMTNGKLWGRMNSELMVHNKYSSIILISFIVISTIVFGTLTIAIVCDAVSQTTNERIYKSLLDNNTNTNVKNRNTDHDFNNYNGGDIKNYSPRTTSMNNATNDDDGGAAAAIMQQMKVGFKKQKLPHEKAKLSIGKLQQQLCYHNNHDFPSATTPTNKPDVIYDVSPSLYCNSHNNNNDDMTDSSLDWQELVRSHQQLHNTTTSTNMTTSNGKDDSSSSYVMMIPPQQQQLQQAPPVPKATTLRQRNVSSPIPLSHVPSNSQPHQLQHQRPSNCSASNNNDKVILTKQDLHRFEHKIDDLSVTVEKMMSVQKALQGEIAQMTQKQQEQQQEIMSLLLLLQKQQQQQPKEVDVSNEVNTNQMDQGRNRRQQPQIQQILQQQPQQRRRDPDNVTTAVANHVGNATR